MTLTVHTEKHLLSHAKPFCPVVYIEDDEGNGEGNRAPGFDSGPPQCPYVHVSLLGFRLRSLVKKKMQEIQPLVNYSYYGFALRHLQLQVQSYKIYEGMCKCLYIYILYVRLVNVNYNYLNVTYTVINLLVKKKTFQDQ